MSNVIPATLNLEARQNADFRRRLTMRDELGDPIDLTGFVIDADITDTSDRAIIATFSHEYVDAANGVFDLYLPKTVSVNLVAGNYGWDLSLTSGIGERQYYLTGTLTIIRTRSREGQP
ncbi:MAG: hypothetical protein ACO280_08225 [Pseudohongiellaceae bacterium]